MTESSGQEVAPEQISDKWQEILSLYRLRQTHAERLSHSSYSVKAETDRGHCAEKMQKCIEQFKIAKREGSKPDTETESIKTEIIRIDGEIQKLMEKLADADSVLFGYIQKRVSTLHEQKSAFERKLQTKTRKRKAIDTKPLEEPLKNRDSLTVQEKHDVAAEMIDVIYISHHSDKEIEIVFGI